MLTHAQTERLLDDLSGRLGLSLPPEARAPLLDDPPADAETFTEEVLAAEGLDPETMERYLFRQVHSMVARAFVEAQRIDHGQDAR